MDGQQYFVLSAIAVKEGTRVLLLTAELLTAHSQDELAAQIAAWREKIKAEGFIVIDLLMTTIPK